MMTTYDRKTYVAAQSRQSDQILDVVTALLALAVIIALIGSRTH